MDDPENFKKNINKKQKKYKKARGKICNWKNTSAHHQIEMFTKNVKGLILQKKNSKLKSSDYFQKNRPLTGTIP